MQLFWFASEQPNLGPLRLRPTIFSFAEVVALFSLGPFRFAFQLFVSMHSQSFTQKLPLGKGFGYAVPEHTFHDACTIRGNCPLEGATHFSGHNLICIILYTYVYPRALEYLFQLYLLVWGSLRSPYKKILDLLIDRANSTRNPTANVGQLLKYNSNFLWSTNIYTYLYGHQHWSLYPAHAARAG